MLFKKSNYSEGFAGRFVKLRYESLYQNIIKMNSHENTENFRQLQYTFINSPNISFIFVHGNIGIHE